MNPYTAKQLQDMAAELLQHSDAQASVRPAPGKWSAKEIIGHLIDSAVNNHVRFVRAQAENPLHIPPYAQNHWVTAQGHQDAPWTELVNLWLAYNLHLLRILECVPAEAHGHQIMVGQGEPVTLEFIATDYYQHLEHHIRQARDTLSAG